MRNAVPMKELGRPFRAPICSPRNRIFIQVSWTIGPWSISPRYPASERVKYSGNTSYRSNQPVVPAHKSKIRIVTIQRFNFTRLPDAFSERTRNRRIRQIMIWFSGGVCGMVAAS